MGGDMLLEGGYIPNSSGNPIGMVLFHLKSKGESVCKNFFRFSPSPAFYCCGGRKVRSYTKHVFSHGGLYNYGPLGIPRSTRQSGLVML